MGPEVNALRENIRLKFNFLLEIKLKNWAKKRASFSLSNCKLFSHKICISDYEKVKEEASLYDSFKYNLLDKKNGPESSLLFSYPCDFTKKNPFIYLICRLNFSEKELMKIDFLRLAKGARLGNWKAFKSWSVMVTIRKQLTTKKLF